MNTTKILILEGDMSRGGGTERMTQILSSLLSQNSSYTVYVVSLSPCIKSYYELDEKVKYFALGDTKLSICKSICRLYKFIKVNDIDLIINVDSFLSIYTIPLKFLSQKIKIISWEMFNLENDLGISWSDWLRKFSLKYSDYYVCLTKKDLLAFKKRYFIKIPITYIYNPCENDLLHCASYDETSKKIITVGNFFYTKGYDLAVEVARLVLHKHHDWQWYFYGDGIEFANIQNTVRQYNLENQVILAGREQNLSKIYKNSAIYVMTSRLEGFGLVLLEAKSNSLPTIAFDCPSGPAEIIEDNISGFLIPAFDINAMADKIEMLIMDHSKRLEFAQNAKNNLDQFSMDAFRSKWDALIKELLSI